MTYLHTITFDQIAGAFIVMGLIYEMTRPALRIRAIRLRIDPDKRD